MFKVKNIKIISLLLCMVMVIGLFAGCQNNTNKPVTPAVPGITDGVPNTTNPDGNNTPNIDPSEITDPSQLRASMYAGEPFVAINDYVPYFTDAEKKTTEVFENYSPLDSLGRCGVAYANLCKELMPTEDRESLSSVTPSGWKNKKYDSELVDGGWIYNRAHIIGFQLAGEQANKLNLITGTRYVDGMLTFENMVADYIKETNNHVLYRVTPIYNGNNLVAEGVLIEAYSIEDEGEGVCFNVFCFNVQPGIVIDYATGDSWLKADAPNIDETDRVPSGTDNCVKEQYILNTNSKKFHHTNCKNAETISENNRQEYIGTREELIDQGYSPCGTCKP